MRASSVLLVIKRVRLENAKERVSAQMEARAASAPAHAHTSVPCALPRAHPNPQDARAPMVPQVKMLAQLTHPGVVGYVDSFFHQNYLCIVTEYCEGGDMYKRLKARRHTLSRSLTARGATQRAEAEAEAQAGSPRARCHACRPRLHATRASHGAVQARARLALRSRSLAANPPVSRRRTPRTQQGCSTHIPEDTVLEWLVQTARALAHLHEKRVLHRDLKTQNIFLTKGGDIKLGDFGIARTLNAATEMACTIVGTPFYMSPELMASKCARTQALLRVGT
jgi:serine/threonine protein kinase